MRYIQLWNISETFKKWRKSKKMENMYHSATDLIGNTPLLFLHRYMKKSGISDVNVIAKLEYFNPTGSVKDRVAFKAGSYNYRADFRKYRYWNCISCGYKRI